MQQRAIVVGVLGLAFASAFNPTVSKADTAWTIQDVDQVANAAVVSLIGTPNTSTRGWMLINLANALIRAGDSARAKNILKGAAADLPPLSDVMSMSSFARGAVVRSLARIGDDADAQALIPSDASKGIKANLLTELAVGRAEAGNIGGTSANVKDITLLANAADTALATTSRLGLRRIAGVLIDAGATDDALRIAKSLPDKSLASQIAAGVAVKLCHASKTKAGLDLAESAANDARAAAVSAKVPYLMFAPITAVSKALVACDGPGSAAAFVRTAIPPNTKDVTRDALIDQLGDANLALAVSPLPRPGNLDDLLRRPGLLTRAGYVTEATQTMLDALKITNQADSTPMEKFGQNAALGQLIGPLAKRGAYDAALTAAKATPVVSRNQYYLTILRAAIARKDTVNVRRLTPVIIAAFNEPATGAFLRQMGMENLILSLANGGYPDEARAVFKQLSALPRTINSPPPIRMQPAKLAELRAALGDLSAAVGAVNAAGPMVSPPNMGQIMMLAGLQFSGRARPTRDQMLAAILRARAMLPQIAGPKAWAYSAVAWELAQCGDIANALEFESKIDIEPRATLAAPRDAALAGIAEAQIKAGDLHGALATAMQISKGTRWGVLLNLAAQAPRH